MTRAKRKGSKWEGQFRFGGYWFPVTRRGVIVLFGSAEAARVAAAKAQPSIA